MPASKPARRRMPKVEPERSDPERIRELEAEVEQPIADLAADEHPEYAESQTGILLPKPKHKEIHVLFLKPGIGLDVDLPYDEIMAKIDAAVESNAKWVEFPEPKYGLSNWVPIRTLTEDLVHISTDWRDMTALKQAAKERENELALLRAGIQRGQGTAPSPLDLTGRMPPQGNRAARRQAARR